MTFLIKKLSIALVAGLVVAVGFVAPANAATISPTVTATGVIGTSGTNAYPMTFTATTVGSTANLVQIMLPSGWTFAITPPNNCTWITITGITPSSCMGNNGGGFILQMGSTIPSNTTVTVLVPANTLNAASSRNFGVMFEDNSSSLVTVDNGIAVLAGGVSNSTVTFDANGGTGTTAAQTASSATALTANGFTRSGYSFAGWNTAANGSGTAYTDGASYSFSSSATLYAQWTASLANTGINSADVISFLIAGASLALVGAELIMIARRKRSS